MLLGIVDEIMRNAVRTYRHRNMNDAVWECFFEWMKEKSLKEMSLNKIYVWKTSTI